MRISVASIFRDQLKKFRRARQESTHHHAHSTEISQYPNAQLEIATIAMGTSVSGEASAAPTPRDEERGGFLQTSILLLNLALPIAEVFTPVKVIVGFLLESAKLLDKRNANLNAIKAIASRADDLMEALSTYAPEAGATPGGQLEASGMLNKISQTLIGRISVIILKIKDVEKRGILRNEAVASALQDAKSGLDQCVEFAHIQLSLYHGRMMQDLLLQMSSVNETCAITRRTLEALQPSIQRSVVCKTFRFVDMTGREHHVPCGVAFAEENFRSFLKEVLFSGQDTVSALHKSLLQNSEDRIDLHSSTQGCPADEETVIYMNIKRKLKSLKALSNSVSLQPEAATAEIEAPSKKLNPMIVLLSIPDSTIDDILDNPLIHKDHIVDAVTCEVRAIFEGQLHMQGLPGQPYFTYSGRTLLKRLLWTNTGEQEMNIIYETINATSERLPLKHKVENESIMFFSKLSDILCSHVDQLLSTSQQEFQDSPSSQDFMFTGVVSIDVCVE